MPGYFGRFGREFQKTLGENHNWIRSVLEPVASYEALFNADNAGDREEYVPVGKRIMIGAAMGSYAIIYAASQSVMTLLKTPRMIKNAMEG